MFDRLSVESARFAMLSEASKKQETDYAIGKSSWIKELLLYHYNKLGLKNQPNDAPVLFLGPGFGYELALARNKKLWPNHPIVAVDHNPYSLLTYICKQYQVQLLKQDFTDIDAINYAVAGLGLQSPFTVISRNAEIVTQVVTDPTKIINQRDWIKGQDGNCIVVEWDNVKALASYAQQAVSNGGAYIYTVASINERDILYNALATMGLQPTLVTPTKANSYFAPQNTERYMPAEKTLIALDMYHLVGRQ